MNEDDPERGAGVAQSDYTAFYRNILVAVLIVVMSMASLFFSRSVVREKGVEESGEMVRAEDGKEQVAEAQRTEQVEDVRSETQKPAVVSALPLPEGTEFESPFVKVADRLKPAVVNIQTVREQEGETLEDLFGLPETQPEKRRVASGGSGVIISSKGHVLTNHHVIERAVEMEVVLSDGSERSVRIVGTDPETDLALLEIGEVDSSWVAELGDSDSIKIGDWAVAIGNPFEFDWTLTVGVISAMGRSDLRIAGGGPTFQNFIQTDASINLGNSGGPLANIKGEVIGINSAVNSAAQGIGFAIPVNMAKGVVEELLDHGYVRRGYLGMVPVELDDLRREALELDREIEGVFVESVEKGTPAESGGLVGSDVIVELDGEPVRNVADFRMRIANRKPGEELSVTVLRDERKRKLNFTLGNRNDFVILLEDVPLNESRTEKDEWMGIEVATLETGSEAYELMVESGVLVVGVAFESFAYGKIEPGDVIVELNHEEVATMDDWRAVTKGIDAPQKAILVKKINRGTQKPRFVALKP